MSSDFRSQALDAAANLRNAIATGNEAEIAGWSAGLEGYLAAADGTGQLDTLERLNIAASVDRALEADVYELVKEARSEGKSWREISEALGVAPQSAWERFSKGNEAADV